MTRFYSVALAVAGTDNRRGRFHRGLAALRPTAPGIVGIEVAKAHANFFGSIGSIRD